MSQKPITPKKALIDWCEKNDVGPKELAATIHCEYQHAWNLLRGEYPVTMPTLARLLVYYGTDGPAPAIAAALRAEKQQPYVKPSIRKIKVN